MPAVHHKLFLEDALQDSPQTRSLLSVFEEDAGMLTDYTNQLLQSMQRVYGAQSEMGLATEQLSRQLIDYEKKNFALGKGDEEVVLTLKSFAKTVGELNSLHSDLAHQMADSMVFPLIQFREKDLTGKATRTKDRTLFIFYLFVMPAINCQEMKKEISTLKEIFSIATDEHEAAMVKYSRLPKKKENEKVKSDLVKEVAYTRRKQHSASLQYYCALNALQYRKRVAMLEPMLGYTQAQIRFFKKGIELVSKKMDNFLSSVSNMTQNIQAQLDSEAEGMRAAQRELLSVEDTVYMPDMDTEPVNRTLIQKAGYLNIRNKTGLVTTAWDRLYFFTQGGNLIRYCFQITSPSGKTSMILQAESKREYEEWICTVNNISRQIYLTDNPESSDVLGLSLGNTDFQLPPKTFYGVEIWRLAKPLQDLEMLLTKPLLRCPGGVFGIIDMLKDPATKTAPKHDVSTPMFH
ncbi:hypothetical protein JOQ06_003175, partial [Pogonophryne albipinna]